MATNIWAEDNDDLSLVCSDPATPAANDPVRVGDKIGVALTNERPDGTTSVGFRRVAKFAVKGVNGSGNSAVAVNDTVFYVDADTPKLSKKVSGVRAGIALDPVGSGATATIRVLLG